MTPDLRLAAEQVIRIAGKNSAAFVVIVDDEFTIFRNTDGPPEIVAQILEAVAERLRQPGVKPIALARPS